MYNHTATRNWQSLLFCFQTASSTDVTPARLEQLVEWDKFPSNPATQIFHYNPRQRKTSTSNKIYTCKVCQLTFGTPSGLRFHSIKHGTRDFQYRCPFCEVKPWGSNSTTAFKEHLRKHGGSGFNYYCYLCETVIEKVKDFIAHAQECKAKLGNRETLWYQVDLVDPWAQILSY